MNPTIHKRDWGPLLQGGLLVLLVCLVYFPSLRGDFLWDDDDNVTGNATLRSLDGLRRIWLEPGATQQYYPLTHTTFWLDYHLWGLHPMGYHAANILLHAASAVLLWLLLLRLRVPGAWLGAAFFALHPVGVESVAWITERKNTLSGVFFLASLLMSLKFWLPGQAFMPPSAETVSPATEKRGPWKFFWLTLFLYVCALCSKTATIGLPAVIVLLAWWKRGKIVRRDVLLLLPLLAVGIGMGLMTAWIEKNNGGATGKEWDFSPIQRVLLAGWVFWFYLWKLAWPHPLMFMYPRWTIQTSQPLAYLPVFFLAAGVIILWCKRHAWGRFPLVVVGYFIALLFPVMGFFNVFFYRFSFVCDHFQYLACMGPLALAAAGITVSMERLQKRLLLPVSAVLLLVLGALSWRQTGIYQSREILWRDSLAHNPDSALAHNNYGRELALAGKFAEAVEHYRRALQLRPDDERAHNNLGLELARLGKVDEAVAEYRAALQLRPDLSQAHVNLGNLLDARGDFGAAAGEFALALQTDPDDFDANFNLGNELARMGKMDDAIIHYHAALKARPDFVGVHRNLGLTLAAKGSVNEAIEQLTFSIEVNPEDAVIHFILGDLMARRGDPASARAQFREVLRINPGYPEARQRLEALEAVPPARGPAK